MSSLLKQTIHSSLARTFYSDLLSQRNMYYYFLGKTLDWPAGDVPPAIDDTFTEESTARNNIIHMKRISINDVSFVVRRIDWENGVVYDRYDGDISPSNPAASGATHVKHANFYVVTDAMNVYKCIHNNYGQPSTVKPSGTDYDFMYLSDGYVWKYMYSVPPSLQYRFMTSSLLPVTQALYQRYYDNMGITGITINSGGHGYEGGPVTTASVLGNGTGATIGLNIDPVSGRIDSVRILTSGSGYTSGSIAIITVDGKGHGIYGNPNAVLTPKFISGKLVDVIVEDPGAAYTTNNQTNLIVNGSGSGADIWPVIENGSIVDVVINQAGIGYENATISVESVTGTGAELTISTGRGDVNSIQADVELLAIPGSVVVVDPVDLGTGYFEATCVVTGDGQGLDITPVLYNGQVVRYVVNSVGTGYTWCDIKVNGDGTGATCKALMSPYKGHGFNAIDELFANMVTVYTTIKFEQNQGISITNDYRQFGIIRNPEDFADGTIYRDLNGSTCHLMTFPNAVDVLNDQEFVLIGDETKKFIVVATDKKTKVIFQDLGGANISGGASLKRVSDNKIYQVNQVTSPDISKKSGDMLFMDNRYSIFQTSDQYISLRTTLQF